MSQTDFTPEVRNPQRGRWGWLRALLIGVVLFVITTVVMFLTGNPNLYPTVILIGNFLVPIVFVAFLYDHQHLSTLTPETVATSFCIGGVLCVLGASVLESRRWMGCCWEAQWVWDLQHWKVPAMPSRYSCSAMAMWEPRLWKR